jgi:FixJ family two-component response regulator
MMTPTATVFVIDDDEAVRKSLGRLLGAAHYRIELFRSASEFLSRSAHPRTFMRRCRGALERLMPREFQVMRLVITGLLNKQVGADLGMAEKTVKTHRGHVMQKLGITSVAQLIGVVKKAEVPPLVRPTTKVS